MHQATPNYASTQPGMRHTRWHAENYHTAGECSAYGTACVVLAEIEAAHAEALEFAEVIGYEQQSFEVLTRHFGIEAEAARGTVRLFREDASTMAVSDAADEETRRYYMLVGKHGTAIPFVLTH